MGPGVLAGSPAAGVLGKAAVPPSMGSCPVAGLGVMARLARVGAPGRCAFYRLAYARRSESGPSLSCSSKAGLPGGCQGPNHDAFEAADTCVAPGRAVWGLVMWSGRAGSAGPGNKQQVQGMLVWC